MIINDLNNLKELVGMEFRFVNKNEGQEMEFHNEYRILSVHEEEYEYHGHVVAEFEYLNFKNPDALQSGEIYKEEDGRVRVYFHDGWDADNYVYFNITKTT